MGKLKERIQAMKTETSTTQPERVDPATTEIGVLEPDDVDAGKRLSETTDEELEFLRVVKDLCVRDGVSAEDVIGKDTLNYFNISFRRPTRWFLRLFSGGRRKSVVIWVPVVEARTLAPGFVIEDAPSVFGVSRVYIDSTDQIAALRSIISRSLQLLPVRGEDRDDESEPLPVAETEMPR